MNRVLFLIGFFLLSACTGSQPQLKLYEKEGMFFPISSASSASVGSVGPRETTELIPDETGLVIDDHVQFSVDMMGFHVRKEIYDVTPMIEELAVPDSKRCGKPFSESHKTRLLDAYATGEHIIYTVYDPEVLIQSDYFFVEVIPNAMGYKSVEEASADLDTCGAGPWWVTQVSKKWLLSFGSACGGAALDGDRCGLLEEIVGYTVTLR